MGSVAIEHPVEAELASALVSNEDKSAARQLLVIDSIFLTIFIAFAFLAPAGQWYDEVVGVQVSGWNGDPGAGYVVGSLYAFTGQRREFVGHPGMPMQIVIGALAHLVHWFHRISGGNDDLFQFWARHFRWLFILGSVVIALCHVISFHALFSFVKRLMGDAKVALVAVLAYATAFPVMFYSTRVAPEPVLVIGFLMTILSLWNAVEAKESSRRSAYGWAALAGVMAMLAVYSKVHLAALLPVFAAGQLLLQPGAGGESLWQRVRRRMGMLGTFIAAAAAATLVGMLRVDWIWFFTWWTRYAPDPGKAEVELDALDYGATVKGFGERLIENLKLWLPGMTGTGIIVIAESLFFLAALIGLVWFWKKHREKRAMLFWPVLYCAAILPVALFRGSWHYLFLHFAIGAVVVAVLVFDLLPRFDFLRRMRPARAAISMVLLIHAVSIPFVIQAKYLAVRKYRDGPRAYYQAVEWLAPGERVVVVSKGGVRQRLMYGVTPRWISGAEEFKEALNALFVTVETRDEVTEQYIKKNRIRAVIQKRGDGYRAMRVEPK